MKNKEFKEQINNIKSMGSLCELESGIQINGVELDYEDFGEKYDIDSESAEPYCCADMQFIPFDEVKKETIDKYDITEKQYREIQEKLDCLSFGCCSWCE